MKINDKYLDNKFGKKNLSEWTKKSYDAAKALHNKSGEGSDFLGWVDLPVNINKNILTDIDKTAKEISKKIEIMLVIGTGGSYLGAKAVIEALSDNFQFLKKNKKYPHIIFAGQNLSEDYLFELRELLSEKSYAVTVISKSGTTTEPAVAFRIFKNDIEEKYGKKEASKRIIAITDKSKGALKKLAQIEGYKTYDIDDDIGGRYSVLSPVGLFPIAVAGFNIFEIIEGAAKMYEQTLPEIDFEKNPAAVYASYRNLFYSQNLDIEILVSYNPKLHFFAEWWKQLFGESEGKQGKGIFPAAADFTSDLHSLGQYIQEGRRNIFETVISIVNPNNELTLPGDEQNIDGLNYIAGKNIDEVNKNAELGTVLAHKAGGVPNLIIEIEKLNEYCIGELIYFFEKACGISGYMLRVNPFDQPGVEAYKKNMFALLGKPGYENERNNLLKNS